MRWTNGCRSEVSVLVRLVKVALGLLVAFLVISGVSAPANLTAAALEDSTGYTIAWWTVDSGGASASEDTSSTYVLGGSIGQPDTAVWAGSGYVLAGGFWGGDVVEHEIYLPLVLRGT
jgi:hypothetical protein